MDDITQIIMGQSPNSINYTNNPDDTILIQGNADLNNGIVVPRIWSSQITKKSYPNDIIFTVRAPVGEIARNPYFATIGRGVASFKGNDFLYQSLIQKKENNYWNNISAGSTFDSINSEQLKNVIIDLPKKDAEQVKIGELFHNLDNLITLHHRKYTYIFYSWEQRKLEDITQIVMGQSPDSINYTENSDDTVLIQGNADLNNGIVVPRIWSSQITKKSYPNDIIFTVRAPVGEIARNPYFATIGRGVASFKGNDFLYQSLIQKKENNYWNNISAGSTFDSINSDQLKNVIIDLPKNNLEQDKIGELFTNLDNLITLHQHKELKRRNDNNEHLRW